MAERTQEWLGELPEAVNEPACCGEFMVSAQRVRARPLAFYQNALRRMQVLQELNPETRVPWGALPGRMIPFFAKPGTPEVSAAGGYKPGCAKP